VAQGQRRAREPRPVEGDVGDRDLPDLGVFTLPAAIGAIAFHNKAAVYDLLFRTAAETLITVARRPCRAL
jgi:hypothetical protein